MPEFQNTVKNLKIQRTGHILLLMSDTQFRSVIKWDDPDPDYLLEKWSDDGDEIKNASKLIVGPGEGCLLVHEGRIEGLWEEEGLFKVNTGNIPFWTTLASLTQGGESEHKVSIWFFHKTMQTQQKFGTPLPVKYLDPVYQFPVGLRVFGNFSYRISDPKALFRQITGSNEFEAEDARRLIGSRLVQPLTETLSHCAFSYTQIDSHRSEISQALLVHLRDEMLQFGLEITDCKIDGTSFDDETMKRINRISDLQAEAIGARAVGLDFTALKEAEAISIRAATGLEAAQLKSTEVAGFKAPEPPKSEPVAGFAMPEEDGRSEGYSTLADDASDDTDYDEQNDDDDDEEDGAAYDEDEADDIEAGNSSGRFQAVSAPAPRQPVKPVEPAAVPDAAPNAVPSAAPLDPVEALKKLKSLRELDLITQEEFDTKRSAILARL